MALIIWLLCLTAALVLAAIWFHRTDLRRPDPLILIGLDGFRWDFLERTETPALDSLVASGVRAERLIPSFPTKTFPNHFTLVTGLRPDHHGIVGNDMYDPITDESFALWNRAAVQDGHWWEAEPIWITAESRGWATAPIFWPGSEAEIGGLRPTWWEPYEHERPLEARVDRLLELLALPPAERPVFSTLYFADVDSAAHDADPDISPHVGLAIRRVDRVVGRLLAGLERLGLQDRVDIVVVSDHGMAATSSDKLIFLDDLVDPEIANVVSWSPVLGLWPADDALDAVRHSMVDRHPHLTVWERDEIPDRLYLGSHRRVPPLVGLADEGWSITTRNTFQREPGQFDGGDHGYDPALPSMSAIFVASGPSFRTGVTVPPFENVSVYEVMCRALGLEPLENDGNSEVAEAILDD